MPREPRGNIDATMAAIGRELIRSRRNYEEALLNAIGSGASAARPLIDLDALLGAFRDMGVQLRVEERRALEAFYRERGTEGRGEVQLLQLLEEVGLPAQTIGA